VLLLAVAGATAASAPLASAPARAASSGTVTGRILISPVAIDLVLQPSTARAGTSITAHVTVTNLGQALLARVAVRLRAPDGIAIRPSPSRLVRRLSPASSSTLDWSLCGRRPGAYLVFAEAMVDGVAVDSPVRLLTVTSGAGTCGGSRPRH
jgi:uncharacterized membrane protein